MKKDKRIKRKSRKKRITGINKKARRIEGITKEDTKDERKSKRKKKAEDSEGGKKCQRWKRGNCHKRERVKDETARHTKKGGNLSWKDGGRQTNKQGSQEMGLFQRLKEYRKEGMKGRGQEIMKGRKKGYIKHRVKVGWQAAGKGQ